MSNPASEAPVVQQFPDEPWPMAENCPSCGSGHGFHRDSDLMKCSHCSLLFSIHTVRNNRRAGELRYQASKLETVAEELRDLADTLEKEPR
jgi:primosomal protein N'